MAGSLIKIDEFTVSSAVANVIIGGGSSGSSSLNASIDSTYDVYQIVANNLRPATAAQLEVRLTKSGSAQSDSEYDWGYKNMYTGGSYVNENSTNQDSFFLYSAYEETTATGKGNGIVLYLFNFPNSSEYSYFTVEQSRLFSTGTLGGNQGGCVHTVASASDGVQFLWDGGHNFEDGTFQLFGLKK